MDQILHNFTLCSHSSNTQLYILFHINIFDDESEKLRMLIKGIRRDLDRDFW